MAVSVVPDSSREKERERERGGVGRWEGGRETLLYQKHCTNVVGTAIKRESNALPTSAESRRK